MIHFQNALQGQEVQFASPDLTMQEVLAHNDYQKPNPFHHAYAHRVGIMEADLYFHENRVLVAHDPSELSLEQDLEQRYLLPLQEKVRRYGGAYPEDDLSLALMLDIKNESADIMNWITTVIIPRYPDLFGEGGKEPVIQLIISGDRPPPHSWALLPRCVKIDGRLTDDIPLKMRERIHMVSASFSSVVEGPLDRDAKLTPEQLQSLRKAIHYVHEQNLKIRFWGGTRCTRLLGLAA